jgi:hypothetical protein
MTDPRQEFPRANLLRRRKKHFVEVFISRGERDLLADPDFQALTDQWPPARIAQVSPDLALTTTRLCHLLGISEGSYRLLLAGERKPSPSLCRRMEQLYDMHARGELHRSYVPKNPLDLQRLMCLYRHWYFNEQTPSTDLPLVTLNLELRWGGAAYQKLRIPIRYLPALRLKTWGGLVDVIRTLKRSLGGLAKSNGDEMWKDAEQRFWHAYATGTIPEEVERRNKLYQFAVTGRLRALDTKKSVRAAQKRMEESL